MPSVLGAWFVRLIGYVAATWIAFEAGAGIHSEGPATRRLLAALVIVGLAALPVAAISWMFHRGDVWDNRPVALWSSFAVVGALLLAVPVCRALGLPYEVSGFWGLVLATAAVGLVAFQAGRVFVQVVVGDARAHDVPLFGGYLLSVGGLWLIEAALPGVHFPGSLGEKLATLAVLAAFFRVLGGNIVYFIGRIIPSVVTPLVVCGLKLWALCWLSTALTTTMSIDGAGAFALAVAMLTVVTAPVWLFEQYSRADAEAEQDRLQWEAHQRAVMDLTMTSALGAARWRRGPW